MLSSHDGPARSITRAITWTAFYLSPVQTRLSYTADRPTDRPRWCAVSASTQSRDHVTCASDDDVTMTDDVYEWRLATAADDGCALVMDFQSATGQLIIVCTITGSSSSSIFSSWTAQYGSCQHDEAADVICLLTARFFITVAFFKFFSFYIGMSGVARRIYAISDCHSVFSQ